MKCRGGSTQVFDCRREDKKEKLSAEKQTKGPGTCVDLIGKRGCIWKIRILSRVFRDSNFKRNEKELFAPCHTYLSNITRRGIFCAVWLLLKVENIVESYFFFYIRNCF